MNQWHYATGAQKHGPVSSAELAELARSGTITPTTLVWREGMAQWQPYSQAVLPGDPAAADSGPPLPDDQARCAVSGKVFPKREMIQYEGRWVSAERRDEFFQRLREGVTEPGATGTVPGPFGYGGFWRRFVSEIVDAICGGIIGAIVGAVLGGIMGASGASQLAITLVNQCVGLAIGIAYQIFFIRNYDATPGKMALGLKLLRADGQKLSTGRIIGRYFAKILSALIFGIGFIMAGFDDEKRALHDRICDTRVIKTR